MKPTKKIFIRLDASLLQHPTVLLASLMILVIFLAGCASSQTSAQKIEQNIVQSIEIQPSGDQDSQLLDNEPAQDLASDVEGYSADQSADQNASSEASEQPDRLANKADSGDSQSSAKQPAPFAEQPPEKTEVGFSAPGFTMTTLDGRSVTMQDLRGKPVLISYWVTWCIPCMEELPALDRLSKEFPNVTILTVNGTDQDNRDEINQKVAELNLALPVLLDETKSFWESYRVMFLPTSFFIDQNGVIKHIQLGSLSKSDLRQKIETLLHGDL